MNTVRLHCLRRCGKVGAEVFSMKRLLKAIWYLLRLAVSDPTLVEKLDHGPRGPNAPEPRTVRR